MGMRYSDSTNEVFVVKGAETALFVRKDAFQAYDKALFRL
jgi:hypothetical protein